MKNPYELAKDILLSMTVDNSQAVSSEAFTTINLYGASVYEKVEMLAKRKKVLLILPFILKTRAE